MKRWLIVLTVLLVVAVVGAMAISHDSPCPTGPGPALAAGVTPMKAVVHHCYGPPEVLRIESIAKPVPEDDQVLVEVHAASINPLDWHFMRGTPYVGRFAFGFGRPEDIRLGVDFSGTVVAVGRKVTRFRAGDEVWGARRGSLAEYITVDESANIELKPERLTFEQAASVPVAAITALQALRDKGQLRAGQKVLINGASGGVGTFAVQIAKAFGAEVTGVSSTHNVDLVRSLGADHVIDYTKQDFTQGSERYDVVVDTVGNHSFLEVRRVLERHGRYVIVGGNSEGKWLGGLATPLAALPPSWFVSQKAMFFIAQFKPEDLVLLNELLGSGKVTPVVDRVYPFARTAEAMGYLEKGHARGKVVVVIDGAAAR